MQIKQVSQIYFSPTGNVRHTLAKIAEGTGGAAAAYDLTPFEARWQKHIFTAADLVLIGMPVYGGRLPANVAEFFRGLRADDTPAAVVVSYGNRDYDDALLELKQGAEQTGFIIIAAAAFIGAHSGSGSIAAGRPDKRDDETAWCFGGRIREKITALINIGDLKDLKVKGKYPYIKNKELPAGPATAGNCKNCGRCAKECPMAAINPGVVREVDSLRCIKCMRCVHHCPEQAKHMVDDRFNNEMALLAEMSAIRKEPDIFI